LKREAATMTVTYCTAEAIADLDELDRLLDVYPSALAEVRLLIQGGLDVWALQVDWGSAEGAGNAVATYRLTDEMRALLLALRARQTDTVDWVDCDSHDSSPSSPL
jgi:hypothetical protein